MEARAARIKKLQEEKAAADAQKASQQSGPTEKKDPVQEAKELIEKQRAQKIEQEKKESSLYTKTKLKKEVKFEEVK